MRACAALEMPMRRRHNCLTWGLEHINKTAGKQLSLLTAKFY